MDLTIYKTKLEPILETILNNNDTSENAVLALGAICSILTYKNDIHIEEKDHIKDELLGADEYYNKYLKTGEEQYKTMAKDELSHAKFLIKEAKQTAYSEEERKYIKDMLLWFNILSDKI